MFWGSIFYLLTWFQDDVLFINLYLLPKYRLQLTVPDSRDVWVGGHNIIIYYIMHDIIVSCKTV